MASVAMLLVLLGLFLIWVIALVDAIRQPEWRWEATRRSKVGWVIGVSLFGWIAGLVYFFSVREDLVRATPKAGAPPPQSKQPRPKVPLRKKDWGDPWQDA